MSTYAIGDIQGCFDSLQALLATINFQPNTDQLWFVGDLVNRGPKSLETLRFIKNLPRKIVVLGNHDLHLLALAQGIEHESKESLAAILTAPDRDELLAWLRQQPLLHHDSVLNYSMVHAGIIPQWSLMQAKKYAAEVETILRGNNYPELLQHMYGSQPDQWKENLTSWDRLRFIINCFTRLRFCTPQGRLDLHYKGGIGNQPTDFFPWFQIPERATQTDNIIFGHWAALEGKVTESHVFALDTGCVWGHTLTAMRLEDRQRFSAPCVDAIKTKN